MAGEFKIRRRSASDVPVSPEDQAGGLAHPLSPPAPQLREDFKNKASRAAVLAEMAAVGERLYGHPITPRAATASRVAAIERAVAASPRGIPAGLDWYPEHQEQYLGVAERTGVTPGRAIDSGASVSPRNEPAYELKSAESAAWIGQHPEAQVEVTPEMSPHVGEWRRGSDSKLVVDEPTPPGTYTLGDMTDEQVASLGFASVKAEQAGATPGLDPRVGNVTRRAAGRPTSVKAVKINRPDAEGNVREFADVVTSPKSRSYATRIQLASTGESRYNATVFRRRHLQQTGEADPNQGVLFSAAEEAGWSPVGRPRLSETPQDMYMNRLTAERAAAVGTTGRSSDEALSDIEHNIKRGRFPGAGPATENPLSNMEIQHAFNNEMDRRASEQINVTSLVRGEPLTEAITPGGAQPVAWTQVRRESGDDAPWNRTRTAEDQFERRSATTESLDTRERDKRQGTINIANPTKSNPAGRLTPKVDKRTKNIRSLPEDLPND